MIGPERGSPRISAPYPGDTLPPASPSTVCQPIDSCSERLASRDHRRAALDRHRCPNRWDPPNRMGCRRANRRRGGSRVNHPRRDRIVWRDHVLEPTRHTVDRPRDAGAHTVDSSSRARTRPGHRPAPGGSSHRRSTSSTTRRSSGYWPICPGSRRRKSRSKGTKRPSSSPPSGSPIPKKTVSHSSKSGPIASSERYRCPHRSTLGRPRPRWRTGSVRAPCRGRGRLATGRFRSDDETAGTPPGKESDHPVSRLPRATEISRSFPAKAGNYNGGSGSYERR